MGEFEKMGVKWVDEEIGPYINIQFKTEKEKKSLLNDLEQVETSYDRGGEVNNISFEIVDPLKFAYYWNLGKEASFLEAMGEGVRMYYTYYRGKYKINMTLNNINAWIQEQNKRGNEGIKRLMPEYELKKIFEQKADEKLVKIIVEEAKDFEVFFESEWKKDKMLEIQCEEMKSYVQKKMLKQEV